MCHCVMIDIHPLSYIFNTVVYVECKPKKYYIRDAIKKSLILGMASLSLRPPLPQPSPRDFGRPYSDISIVLL